MSNPVSKIVNCSWGEFEYKALAFLCPGCKNDLHMLPISGNLPPGKPMWEFSGTEECPTLSPSILTKYPSEGKEWICHSFMREGVFEFLTDCTHEFSGQKVPVPELPDWFMESHQ